MMIRDSIRSALTTAMKAREPERVAVLRMIQAAIKNRDIELRTGPPAGDDDAIVIEVLTKMAKQRRESIEMFEKGGRQELAEAEQRELRVIEAFLPRQMSEEEARKVIEALKVEVGASSSRDMGKVMAELKARYAGQIDMSRASGMVKAALAG